MCCCACPQSPPSVPDFQAAYRAMHGDEEAELSEAQCALLFELHDFLAHPAH